MDKDALKRLESSLHQMKNALLSNERLKKLLFYSSGENKSLELLKEVSSKAVEENIFLQLVVSVDTTPPFDKRNFIAIRLNSCAFENGRNNYVFNITVASEKHDWILDGKIRPILIAQEIINTLDDQKFEFSNSLHFYRMAEQLLNDDVTGYTLFFGATDGAHDIS